MTSNEQETSDATYFTGDLSSNVEHLPSSLSLIESSETQQEMENSELGKQTLIEECKSWKKQCHDLTIQKQAIEMRSDVLLAESRRLIEEKENELKDENTHLKNEISNLKESLQSKEQSEKDYNEQIRTLQLQIKELEDWNGDNDSSGTNNQDCSILQSTIDSLTSRNSQLEIDLQRLQFQQRNNQLALERLDEYEETISQLQEELDQLRSNKKKQSPVHDEDVNRLSHLLEETRLQLEEFEREKVILRDQLENAEKQIEIEKTHRQDFEKEFNIREILERQIIDLNEEVQSLENDNYQLQQQLQTRDRQIQTFQMTPGSPPTLLSSIDTRNLSPSQLEAQILYSFTILYDQFVTILPSEYTSSDKTHLSLSDRFNDLFEHFSTYIGTFSIVQEELDSLKQILNEKQDELEKLRTHFEFTTDKLTQLQEEQSLEHRNKSFESDEDELEEILGFQQRAPSQQSLLSITPGEKQLLIAQNELLSSLLNDKEQELIELQQAEKSREDLIKTLQILRSNLQDMELQKEMKLVELNDIRNILDEKLRENSSLKKEKMFFIEKLSQLERERQEQQTIIQIAPKQTTPDREKSPSTTIIHTTQQNVEQYENLRSEYDQLLELSTRQHEESLSYYNEYTRILILYNELTVKLSQLQIDYDSIHSLFQQKNEAYLQCQNELNTYQNLLYHQKKKSDDIDLLQSTLHEREIQLQKFIDDEKQWLVKQSELELNLKLLEKKNSKFLLNQQILEEMQLDLKRVSHERDLAIVEKKQLEHLMEKLVQSEEKLTKEIERLVKQERLRDEHQMNNARSQEVLFTELDTVKFEYVKLEETNSNLNEQIKYLQNNLEHFQQERDCRNNEYLVQYQDSLREQISISARLTNENNEIRQEIASRDSLINDFQLEIDSKSKQIIESEENFQTANNSRVEKQLVKNILLSYFHTPIDKQHEVVPLIGALVGFTQDEYQKAMNAIANNYNNTSGTSWLTGWLGPTSSKTKTQSDSPVYHPDKSFAELLIQYVDQQSTDDVQQPILKSTTDDSSVPTSDNNATQFTT